MNPLLIAEPPLQVLPQLAAEVGVNEAIVLQQIHYWSLQKFRAGEDPWVYNTQAEWLEQFPWLTLRTLQRVLDRLRERELLQMRQPEGTNRRAHYLVEYANLPCSDAAKLAASSRHFGGMTNTNTKTTQRQPPVSPLPGKAIVRGQVGEDVAAVRDHFVATMRRRGRAAQLGADDLRIIREALKAGDRAELIAAITACEASDYHMKRGAHAKRPGGRYNSLGKIFKPRPTKGETWRSRLDWWLERAEEQRAGATATFDVNAEFQRIREAQEAEG